MNKYKIKTRWDVTIHDYTKDETGIISFDKKDDILPFIEDSLKKYDKIIILKIERFYTVDE